MAVNPTKIRENNVEAVVDRGGMGVVSKPSIPKLAVTEQGPTSSLAAGTKA